jgi:hypothetical protein
MEVYIYLQCLINGIRDKLNGYGEIAQVCRLVDMLEHRNAGRGSAEDLEYKWADGREERSG